MTLTPHIQTAIRIHADELIKTATARQTIIDEGIAFVQGEALVREKEQITHLQSTAAALIDYANSLSVKVQIEPSRKVHNPDGLSFKQVEAKDGWRLLFTDEIMDQKGEFIEIEAWKSLRFPNNWDNSGWSGSSVNTTYRTKLTREELKQKRGL